MQTLLERFWTRVLSFPEQDFCEFVTVEGRRRISCSEIGRLACIYQRAFDRQNVPRGTVVLIFLPHCVDMYAAFVGAMSAGLVPSFMSPPSPKQDPAFYWPSHQALLQRLGNSIVLADNATLQSMLGAAMTLSHVLTPDTVYSDEEFSVSAPTSYPNPDDIAFLQHSSGTTGLKKGVTLTYRQVDEQLSSYAASLSLASEDVIVSWLPLYHDMGLIACFLLPIHKGIKFVHMDAFHWLSRPTILLELLHQCRGTLCWLPNFAFDHLANVATRANLESVRLDSVRAFINCSEPCRATTFGRFRDKLSGVGLRAEALQCCYAMAETVFAVSQTKLSEPPVIQHFSRITGDVGSKAIPSSADAEGSIPLLSSGSPIDGIEVQVLDVDGKPVPTGTVGQLVVKGGFVFSGYYKNAELTNTRLKDGWYHTQDLGFIYGENIFVLGRADDVIICNGKNVYAHDVESSIAGIQGVKAGRCIAVSVDDQRSGSQRLAIVAEWETDDRTVLSHAREAIRSRVFAAAGIPPYVVRFVPPGWLVKTTSGKISRKDNAAKYKSSFGG